MTGTSCPRPARAGASTVNQMARGGDFLHAKSNLDLPLVLKVFEISGDRELYLVGGAVRDALLDTRSHDFDFAVAANAIDVARQVSAALGGDFYVLDEAFDAGRVILTGADDQRDVLDFSKYRGEGILADLAGRDFTINAIAYDPRRTLLLDPMQGAADLRAKLMRGCTASSIRDDPVRILRAIRLATALGFHIEDSTRLAIKADLPLLIQVSPERRRDELFRILDARQAAAALRAIEVLGGMSFLAPELAALGGVAQHPPHLHDVWNHTLAVIQNLDAILAVLAEGPKAGDAEAMWAGVLALELGRYRGDIARHLAESPNQDRSHRSLLFFGALYHDAGKPITRTIGEDGRIRFKNHEQESAGLVAARVRELRLSNAEARWLRTLVCQHGSFHELAKPMELAGDAPSRRAIYQFFQRAEGCGPDLVLLGLADVRGARGETLTEKAWSAFVHTARILLENLWEKPQEAVRPPPLLDGHDLMITFQLESGPQIGLLLAAIREAQAAGEIHDRAEALELAQQAIGSGDLRGLGGSGRSPTDAD
jgi:tRNA nucleotidyltransferase/poly(A) polymerase